MGGEDDGIMRDKIVMDPARGRTGEHAGETKIKETIRVRIRWFALTAGLIRIAPSTNGVRKRIVAIAVAVTPIRSPRISRWNFPGAESSRTIHQTTNQNTNITRAVGMEDYRIRFSGNKKGPTDRGRDRNDLRQTGADAADGTN